MFTKTTFKFSLIAVLIALSATEMIEEAVWQDSEWLKSNLEELDNYLIRDIPSQVGKQSKEQLGFFVSNGYNRPNIISLCKIVSIIICSFLGQGMYIKEPRVWLWGHRLSVWGDGEPRLLWQTTISPVCTPVCTPVYNKRTFSDLRTFSAAIFKV